MSKDSKLYFYWTSSHQKGLTFRTKFRWILRVFRLHPHLSQRYNGAPDGFFAPQFWQNFPWFTVPQVQVHPSSNGLGEPHSGQNFPVAIAPHLHFHLPAWIGSGFFAPHSVQNFPVTTAPHAHFQLSWDCCPDWFCAVCCSVCCICCICCCACCCWTPWL